MVKQKTANSIRRAVLDRLENCSGPLQLDVVSGSARVDWTFTGESRIRADMGILLTFMFLVNMLGAIVLLPAMARWFWRHHTSTTAVPLTMRNRS